MRMRHIVTWPAPPHNICPHYLIKGTIFEKKNIEQKVFVLFFSTNSSETFLIVRRNERDVGKNVYWS